MRHNSSADVDDSANNNGPVVDESERLVGLLTIDDPVHRTADLYGTYRWPETYVIDRQGTLRRKFIGPQTWTSPELADYLSKL